MTLEAAYAAFGGDYQECLSRLRSEALIKKFCQKFLDDGSYDLLVTSMESGNMEEAFRAAHTLKGVAQNLAYTKLGKAASDLTEALRPGNPHDEAATAELYALVKSCYEETVTALKAFFAE